MAVAFESVGAVATVASANNNAFTAALPTTRPVGSVLLLVAGTRLITATLATPSGWTLMSGFPKTSGTASGGRLWVFGRTVTGSETAPSLAFTGPVTGTTGDDAGGFVICYSGVETASGIANIFDTAATVQDASGTTTCTYPAITTTVANSMLVRTLIRFRDAADTFTPTASPLHTERVDAGSTNRTGRQHHLQDMAGGATGVKAAVTVAPSNTTASRYLAVSMALKELVLTPVVQQKAFRGRTESATAGAALNGAFV